MTHPLKLSPDYTPLGAYKKQSVVQEQKNIKKERKRMQKEPPKLERTYRYSLLVGKSRQFFYNMYHVNPVKYRFIQFHGKGDLAAGYDFYKKYCERMNVETRQIVKILTKNRLKRAFSKYIHIDTTTLSHHDRRQNARVSFRKLMFMKKITKNFDTFMKLREAEKSAA